MVITMIIYIAIPQLRKLHGKALICYLFSLVIAYSIMGHILLEGLAKLSINKCFVIGKLNNDGFQKILYMNQIFVIHTYTFNLFQVLYVITFLWRPFSG